MTTIQTSNRAGDSASQDIFPPTRWSCVLRTSPTSDEVAHKSLTYLCETYRPAAIAYFYSKVRGNPLFVPGDAEDLVQSFFAAMIRRDAFYKADPARGKFRQFLLGCLQNHFRREVQARSALKAENPRKTAPLDDDVVPRADENTPDSLYALAFLRALIHRAFERFERDILEKDGSNLDLFRELAPAIRFAPAEPLDPKGPKASGGAVRTQLSRWRKGFVAYVSTELRETVDNDPRQFREEIEYLKSVLAKLSP